MSEQLSNDKLHEIELRDLSDEDAREEILAFISDRPKTDSAEIFFELGIEHEQVTRVCEELMKNGEIEWADEYLISLDTPSAVRTMFDGLARRVALREWRCEAPSGPIPWSL